MDISGNVGALGLLSRKLYAPVRVSPGALLCGVVSRHGGFPCVLGAVVFTAGSTCGPAPTGATLGGTGTSPAPGPLGACVARLLACPCV